MNQDRFKFRAWNGEKMLPYLIGVSDGGPLVLDSYCGQWFDGPMDLVLMQCTGLKDKTGKLIYEGDILEGGQLVEWDEVYGCFNPFNEPDKCIDQLGLYEIIGNKYENPKLLEDE